MADLKKLFATKASPDAPVSPDVSDSPESGRVPSEVPAEQTTTPKPANPFGRRSSSGQTDSSGQSGGGTPASGEDASGDSQPKSGLSALSISAATRDSSVDTGSVDAAPINSLESLDAAKDEGIAPRPSVTYFADETPATQPTRELPEGLTKEQLGFVDMLNSVYEIIHDPDLLGGVIRNIMVELSSNAEYTKLMSPEDYRVMVRGMRESMGLARVKKTEAKAKRGTGTRKSTKSLDMDMLADLDSLGIITE